MSRSSLVMAPLAVAAMVDAPMRCGPRPAAASSRGEGPSRRTSITGQRSITTVIPAARARAAAASSITPSCIQTVLAPSRIASSTTGADMAQSRNTSTMSSGAASSSAPPRGGRASVWPASPGLTAGDLVAPPHQETQHAVGGRAPGCAEAPTTAMRRVSAQQPPDRRVVQPVDRSWSHPSPPCFRRRVPVVSELRCRAPRPSSLPVLLLLAGLIALAWWWPNRPQAGDVAMPGAAVQLGFLRAVPRRPVAARPGASRRPPRSTRTWRCSPAACRADPHLCRDRGRLRRGRDGRAARAEGLAGHLARRRPGAERRRDRPRHRARPRASRDHRARGGRQRGAAAARPAGRRADRRHRPGARRGAPAGDLCRRVGVLAAVPRGGARMSTS